MKKEVLPQKNLNKVEIKKTGVLPQKDNLEKVRIKKIGVLSLANLLGILYIFIGFIFGLIVTLSSFFISSLNEGMISIFFGKASIITFPIVYGIMGWISGVFGALLYNLAAKITKGIELYA